MRRGNNPHLGFTEDGEILYFATGSDFCAEHEVGSAEMQKALCQGAAMFRPNELKAKLQAGSLVQYPQIQDHKVLNKNLQQVQFVSGLNSKGIVCGVLIFNGNKYSAGPTDNQRYLDHPELTPAGDTTSAGAWNSTSFAFKVVGAELVEKLNDFYQAILLGDTLFAGTFLEDGDKHLGGVIVARKSRLQAEHLLEAKKAQAQWEANFRLNAFSRVEELRKFAGSKQGTSPGYIWPVWQDQVVDGTIVYALNPGPRVDAPYWGPYTFEALMAWSAATVKPQLIPIERRAAIKAD